MLAIGFSRGNAFIIVNGFLTAAVLSRRLTGAHFNMAVTIGAFLADDNKKMKKNIPLLFIMILSQLIGALFG